ncbi:phosphatidylinositol 4,5-bisphosphate-binding protein [Fusarium poae]|jgi:hypothetical protein|uniref:PH domain-containing protein n=1 Tax=Fusarium poae TaxID=36050 RepID=A0A1B8ANN1_FUSPO|nr:hypothetical protein FPOAC1_009370 [Fusarium poae]KAG8669967.1 hypothetical protein FPOAC1_009370 [Fusarium poae]OBS22173.1 hypothetical protein FPOA_08509 [Fusarium poae]
MDLPSSHSQSQPSSFPQQPSYTYSHEQDSYPESSPAAAANNAHTYSSPQYDDDYHLSNSIHAPQPQSRQPGRFTEEWGAAQRGPSLLFDQSTDVANMQRSNSVHSYVSGDDQQLPGRQNTLKKKNSVRRNGSMKRSSSRRSMRAGSVKSLALQSSSDHDEGHSAFYCPVPTSGNPTETLSNRFQNWRKVLKDLIAYFREIQTHYEHRAKSLLKLANVSNNITTPPGFLQSAGIDDALQFLRDYNKNAILEANKAKDIEEDVILALTGLRSDLQQKIKEIKNLSGDFKNSVDKEMDHTRKAVKTLSDILGRNELDESTTTGKQDPYLLRLAVDRQVERQLDEENYLHQAYLNLENSGRELEAIVVGEIQKAYNAYAGILKREADNSYNLIGELREGPIAMPKDHEWMHFVTHDDKFVDPSIPLRTPDQIHYPGQDHEAAQEIRAGLLERKSKYLKSYTAGWYVLSATHLHEFKTADKAQAPVMSLYLPEQKVGSHSNEGGSSNKFILKGRQTGGMHRGHTWVFRAESHDTMMAWYEDIKALTEKTAEERSQFVRSHSRSLSRSSRRSVSSDGLVDDEDEEPFTADTESFTNPGLRQHEATPRRSQAGGRFPSDIQVNKQRGLQAPHSPSSLSSGFQDNKDPVVPPIVTGGLSGPAAGESQSTRDYGTVHQTPLDEMPSAAAIASQKAHYDGVNPYTSEPVNQSPAGPTSFNQQQQYEPQYEQQQQHPVQLSEYVQNHNQTFLPVMIPQGKDERNDDFSNNEQPHYDEQPNNYIMEPREEPDGRGAMSGNVHPTSDYPQASYEPQPSYDQEHNYGHNNGSANGGTKVNNYTLTTVGEGFPRLDGGATREIQPSTRKAESVYTERDSVLLQTDDEDETSMPTRPSVNNRTESHNTISNLHIPGGYPKSSYAT